MSEMIVRTPVWKVVAAWVFVGIPLLMGIFQTLLNAMKLFQ
jgi:hypothetical protein